MISSLHQPPQQQNVPFWTPFAVIQAQPLPAQIGCSARGYQEFCVAGNPGHGRAGRRPGRMFMQRLR